MSFSHLVAGDFGQVAQLTFIDTDTGLPADISSYGEAVRMVFVDPAGNETLVAAAFATDGTDGVVAYTVEDGLIDEGGWWRVYGRVEGGGARLTTVWHRFKVLG